jgi:hypothetical protein
MSDIARFWSRNLHGLNFAEHAVCRELAEYHVSETDLCYPNMATVCDIYECSRVYVKQILRRLDSWALVTRVEWFDPQDRSQTSNRYKLNLRRHFPDPAPEGRKTRDSNKKQISRAYDSRDFEALNGAKQGRRILKIIANKVPPGQHGLMDGLKEAYLDTRAKKTFVTVDADGYLKEFQYLLSDLQKFVRHETNLDTSLIPVPLFYRQKKR